MTPEEALAFLRSHQPMPSDWDITDAEGDSFSAIIKLFEKQPDPRCLPLLINAVSPETGLGMYEHIQFVLMAHSKDDVIPHLREGFRSGNDGVKYRCCWWAADIGAWDLEDEIQALRQHPDEDVCVAAESFLELKSDLA